MPVVGAANPVTPTRRYDYRTPCPKCGKPKGKSAKVCSDCFKARGWETRYDAVIRRMAKAGAPDQQIADALAEMGLCRSRGWVGLRRKALGIPSALEPGQTTASRKMRLPKRTRNDVRSQNERIAKFVCLLDWAYREAQNQGIEVELAEIVDGGINAVRDYPGLAQQVMPGVV